MVTFATGELAHHLTAARRDNIRVRQKRGSPANVYHVSSSDPSKPGYAVTVTGEMGGTCTCIAGQAAKPCKHLAAALVGHHRKRVTSNAKQMNMWKNWSRANVHARP